MWSFVGRKQNPRWLWGALDHQTGEYSPMSLVAGRTKRCCNSKPYSSPLDSPLLHRWLGGLSPALGSHHHVVGKRRTQQLERKHLTLRTRIKRLVRKTICFSRSIQMHDIVIGLFINRFEFGLAV